MGFKGMYCMYALFSDIWSWEWYLATMEVDCMYLNVVYIVNEY